MKKQGKEPWIRKENIKWLVLFFLLAFALRVFLSTIYEPANNTLTDNYNYLRMNYHFLEGKISFNTRFSTFIMAPLMVFFTWVGLSPLQGTIISGCLISSLTLIPLWMIAEHLKVNPKLVSLFYIFAGLDVARILAGGMYSTEFGILAFSIYTLLMLKGHYKLAPIVVLPQVISHEVTLFLFVFLMVFVLVYSGIKNRKLINDDLKKYHWSFAIILAFSILKLTLLSPGWVANKYSLVSTGISEISTKIVAPQLLFYLEATGSYILVLALFGLFKFYKTNKNLVPVQSWVFLPQILAFLPLFVDSNLYVRVASYGAPAIALVAAYAFKNFKEKHWLMKVIMVLLVIGNIIFVIKAAHFQFYTHSVDYLWYGR